MYTSMVCFRLDFVTKRTGAIMEKMCILLTSDKINLPFVLQKEVALVVGVVAL